MNNYPNQPPNPGYNNYNAPQPGYQPPGYGPQSGMPYSETPIMPSPPNMGMGNPFSNSPTILGPSSCYAKCPSCQKSGYTRVERGFNSNGWIICILLCLFTLCCFFLATCCDSNYEVKHFCSSCNYRIGAYQQ